MLRLASAAAISILICFTVSWASQPGPQIDSDHDASVTPALAGALPSLCQRRQLPPEVRSLCAQLAATQALLDAANAALRVCGDTNRALEGELDACRAAACPSDEATALCCPLGDAFCPAQGCVDILIDPANCGACGHRCDAPMSCRVGECVLACNGDASVCGPSGDGCSGSSGLCTCGGGASCGSDAYCFQGACVAACGATAATPGHSCREIHDACGVTESGLFWLDPNGGETSNAFQAYCDQVSDGGGWALVAKVNPADVDGAPEPHGFFDQVLRPELMTSPELVNNAGLASLSASRFLPAIDSVSLAKFEFVSENDFDQRLTWFKRTEVPAEVPQWLSLPMAAATPTELCRDVAMTDGCSVASLGSDGPSTGFGGMSVPAELGGVATCGGFHMRLDGDEAAFYSAVCSCTLGDPRWADHYDNHWGNALLIWLR
jgi:hypothetical protein